MTRSRRHPDIDPALADAVRSAVVLAPDDAVAERHLAEMAAVEPIREGSASPAPRSSRERARSSLVPRPLLHGAGVLLASVFGLGALTSGLAVAGVDLPEAVNAPFEAVGVELPNQDSDEQRAEPRRKRPEPVRTAEPARTAPDDAARERPSTRLRRERPAGRDDTPAPQRGEDNGRRAGGSDRGSAPPRRRTDPPVAAPRGRRKAPQRKAPKPAPQRGSGALKAKPQRQLERPATPGEARPPKAGGRRETVPPVEPPAVAPETAPDAP